MILIAQEQARQQQPLLQTLDSIHNILKRQPIRTNKSIRIVIDLTVAHNESEAGIAGPNRIFNWVTVEKADSNFSFKLKQTDSLKSDSFTASTGTSLDNHEFTEVYITNTALAGTGIIQAGWRE